MHMQRGRMGLMLVLVVLGTMEATSFPHPPSVGLFRLGPVTHWKRPQVRSNLLTQQPVDCASSPWSPAP